MHDEVAVPAKLDPPQEAIGSEAIAARAREIERTRRADAARITALVQYMLHRGEDGRDLPRH
jgi:hypothetical protein